MMHVSLTNSNTSERTVGLPLFRLQLFECYVIISIPTMFVGLQSDSDDDCSQSTDANALIDCMGYQTFSTMITDWIWRGGFPNTPTLYQTRCNGLSSFLSCPSLLDNAYLGIRGAHGAQSKWCFLTIITYKASVHIPRPRSVTLRMGSQDCCAHVATQGLPGFMSQESPYQHLGSSIGLDPSSSVLRSNQSLGRAASVSSWP